MKEVAEIVLIYVDAGVTPVRERCIFQEKNIHYGIHFKMLKGKKQEGQKVSLGLIFLHCVPIQKPFQLIRFIRA
jgi:hypothetical protein